MILLYANNGTNVSDIDFLDTLRSLGVSLGDTLFIHSDVMVFGRLIPESKDMLLPTIVKVFKEAVGPEGTIVMPTFSYSYCRKKPFDPLHTPSTVGALTNFFRQAPGVVRSTHPLFSVAAWGKNKERMLRVGKDSFGPESSFAVLRELNAKIVLLGVTFEACTFLHYLEQKHNVPYRFIKTFDGTFIDKEGREHEDSCTYFVRPLDENIDNDMTRITPHLREKKMVMERRLGNGEISVVSANDLYVTGMRLLDIDPYYLLAQSSS